MVALPHSIRVPFFPRMQCACAKKSIVAKVQHASGWGCSLSLSLAVVSVSFPISFSLSLFSLLSLCVPSNPMHICSWLKCGFLLEKKQLYRVHWTWNPAWTDFHAFMNRFWRKILENPRRNGFSWFNQAACLFVCVLVWGSSSFNLDLLPPDGAFIPKWILLCSCSPLDVLVSFAVHLSGNSWCFWREVTWSLFFSQTQSVKNSSGRNARRLVVAAKDCCCTGHSWPSATAVIECRTSKHSTDLYDLCLTVFRRVCMAWASTNQWYALQLRSDRSRRLKTACRLGVKGWRGEAQIV